MVMQKPDNAKGTPRAPELVYLDEIASRLADLYDIAYAQSPSSDFRLVTFNITTKATMVFVSKNERLINDGPNDIYVLSADNQAITGQDAAIETGAIADLTPQASEGTPYYIKTATGTATARFLRGGERSKMLVDIVAATIGQLSVNIAAQTLSQLAINVAAQNVGIFLQPDWAAKGGTDKNFTASGTNVAVNGLANVSYTPATKPLYITRLSGGILGFADADKDKAQHGYWLVSDITAGTTLWGQGGDGGIGPTISPALAVPVGHEVQFQVANYSGHPANIAIFAGGYEI